MLLRRLIRFSSQKKPSLRDFQKKLSEELRQEDQQLRQKHPLWKRILIPIYLDSQAFTVLVCLGLSVFAFNEFILKPKVQEIDSRGKKSLEEIEIEKIIANERVPQESEKGQKN